MINKKELKGLKTLSSQTNNVRTEGLIDQFAVAFGMLVVCGVLIFLFLCITNGIDNWAEKNTLEYERYMELRGF